MTNASRRQGTAAWDDVEIRRLIAARQQAHQRHDAAAIVAGYAADAVRYDLAPPLAQIGRASCRERVYGTV